MAPARQIAMMVRAEATGGVQTPVVSARIDARLGELRASLPGYRFEVGGAIEESAKGQGAIVRMLPLTSAPLGLIGGLAAAE